MPFEKKHRFVEEKRTVYVNVTCNMCNEPLQNPVFDVEESEGNLQYTDALILKATGGYGMFIDPDVGLYRDNTYGYDPETTIVLCHSCAHKASKLLNWDISNLHEC